MRSLKPGFNVYGLRAVQELQNTGIRLLKSVERNGERKGVRCVDGSTQEVTYIS